MFTLTVIAFLGFTSPPVIYHIPFNSFPACDEAGDTIKANADEIFSPTAAVTTSCEKAS